MKNKNVWRKKAIGFLTSQCITLLGSSIVQMAIIWHVTLQTSSGIWVTVLTLCSYLPQMLISFFAGAWADRYNRKKMIIISDIIITIATLILAIFIMNVNTDEIVLYAIIIVSIIRSIGTGIQTPAVNATIPQIVPEDNLMKFNGFNSSMQSIIQFASPMIAGMILTFGSITNILFIDIITAIIGISILSFIKIQKNVVQKGEKQSILKEIKEGINFSISNKLIGKLLLIYGGFIFLSVPSGFLTALIIERTFGGEYMFLSISETVGFAGMLLGGLLLGTWGGFKNRNKTLSLGIILYSIFSMLLGNVNQFWIFSLVMFFLSFSIPIVQTSIMTLLQEKLDPQMQGRVFSLLNIMFSGFMPLGMVVFGPLADIMPFATLMIGTGIILFFIGISIPIQKTFYKKGI